VTNPSGDTLAVKDGKHSTLLHEAAHSMLAQKQGRQNSGPQDDANEQSADKIAGKLKSGKMVDNDLQKASPTSGAREEGNRYLINRYRSSDDPAVSSIAPQGDIASSQWLNRYVEIGRVDRPDKYRDAATKSPVRATFEGGKWVTGAPIPRSTFGKVKGTAPEENSVMTLVQHETEGNVWLPDYMLMIGRDSLMRDKQERQAKEDREESNQELEDDARKKDKAVKKLTYNSGGGFDTFTKWLGAILDVIVPISGSFAKLDVNVQLPIGGGAAGVYFRLTGEAERDDKSMVKTKIELGGGIYGELDAGVAEAWIKGGIFGFVESVGNSSGESVAGLFYPVFNRLNKTKLTGIAPRGVGYYIFGDAANLKLTGDEYVDGVIGGELQGGVSWDAPGASEGEVSVGAQGGKGTKYSAKGQEDFSFFKGHTAFALKTAGFDCSGGIEYKRTKNSELKLEGFFSPLRKMGNETLSADDFKAMRQKAIGVTMQHYVNTGLMPEWVLNKIGAMTKSLPQDAANKSSSTARAGAGLEISFKWGGNISGVVPEAFLVLKAAKETGIELGSAELELSAEYGKKFQLM
jgi:hypothetical protein